MTPTKIPEIVSMKLDDLDPNPYNPRRDLKPGDPEFDRIQVSIDEYGQVENLVWNKQTKRLVAGHQRVKVMKALGYEEGLVAVIDEDEDREKALMVALNNPRVAGDWDYDTLADVMASLPDDMQFLTGFDNEREISEMVRAMEIDSATDFLNIDDGLDGKVGPGGAELKEDHPHRTGMQYFQIALVFDQNQRDTYLETIAQAKRVYSLDNSMEAIAAVCKEFLDSHR